MAEDYEFFLVLWCGLIDLYFGGEIRLDIAHKKEKHLTKPEMVILEHKGVPMKRKLKEFPVTEDALLPVGTSISVRHLFQASNGCLELQGKGFPGVGYLLKGVGRTANCFRDSRRQ
ncbi:54S ribosomal protein L3 [Datura stramonium]|uniref:54S ribosomal protein L3 n=1 Tax=Datura stramonium TaxID=4076 RepID=A0ABS8WUN0_DATST|nr:54S ribosomal protein L3 [Datura stramonium]